MAYRIEEGIVETDLQELEGINENFNIKFLTPEISVLIDDYIALRKAVKHKNVGDVQLFTWKYGVSALYSINP